MNLNPSHKKSKKSDLRTKSVKNNNFDRGLLTNSWKAKSKERLPRKLEEDPEMKKESGDCEELGSLELYSKEAPTPPEEPEKTLPTPAPAITSAFFLTYINTILAKKSCKFYKAIVDN